MKFINIGKNQHFNFDAVDYFDILSTYGIEPNDCDLICSFPSRSAITRKQYMIIKNICSDEIFEFEDLSYRVDCFGFPKLSSSTIAVNINKIINFLISSNGKPGSRKQILYIEMNNGRHFITHLELYETLKKMILERQV